MNIVYYRMMSDLCIKWYLEQDEEKKKEIYDNQIIPLYKQKLDAWGNK